MANAPIADFTGLTAPVVVACSGGPDSVALLALATDAGLAPVAVHVDHGLRPDSAADAEVVGAAAAQLGVGWRSVRVAVGTGPNLEARARDARYGALQVAREELGATAILVAHTADDQAETVLLNVLRGSRRGRARRDAASARADRAPAAATPPGRRARRRRRARARHGRRPDERRRALATGMDPSRGAADARTGLRTRSRARCSPARPRSCGPSPSCSTSWVTDS